MDIKSIQSDFLAIYEEETKSVLLNTIKNMEKHIKKLGKSTKKMISKKGQKYNKKLKSLFE